MCVRVGEREGKTRDSERERRKGKGGKEREPKKHGRGGKEREGKNTNLERESWAAFVTKEP